MMRKIFVLLCVVATLISFSGCHKNYTHGVYELTITSEKISNNAVGNDWKKVYTCDGRTITSGERWTIPLDTVKTVEINASFIEDDEWPDVGTGALTIVLQDDYEASKTITVTENKGSHKGNQAQWEITCRVKLIKKIKQ